MKKLNTLITDLKPVKIVGNNDIDFTNVVCDSRQRLRGELFIAVRGVAVDAHRFIPQVQRGRGHCRAVPDTARALSADG